MAIDQPLSSDVLSSPDHSHLHRVVGVDSTATAHGIDINIDGEVIFISNILATADSTQDIGNNSKSFRRSYLGSLYLSTFSTSESFTISDTDGYGFIEIITSAAIATITLPTLADNLGREITVSNTRSTTAFFDGEGAETIENNSTEEIIGSASKTIIGGISQWRVISKGNSLSRGYAARRGGIIQYYDADQVYIPGNMIDVDGKVAYWTSQLTSTALTWGAEHYKYLYLNYSGIISGVKITNSEIIWSTTAPIYSHTKIGWYNGSDRFLGAVHDGEITSEIDPFAWNPAGYYQYTPKPDLVDGGFDSEQASSYQDLDLSNLGLPNLGELVTYIQAYIIGSDGSCELWYRKNGSAGDEAVIGRTDGISLWMPIKVITDNSQIFEYKLEHGASADFFSGWVIGYDFLI